MGNIGRKMALALLLAVAAGCASGRPLSLSGSLVPPEKPVSSDNVLPRVAVVDFEFSAPENEAIGRDYDNVRPIQWKGSPGPVVADLVAASLIGRGVPVVRVQMAGHVPAGVLVTVRGRVDLFRVDAKRIHSFRIESVAQVGMTVYAEGEGVPAGWSSGPVSSEVWSSEPFFVTPVGVREALASAAEGAADEAVRSLMKLSGRFSPAEGRPEPGAAVPPAPQ